MKEPIRILHFVPNLFSGGTETFIMNMYRNIDRKMFQFDFVVHTKEKGVFEDEIKQLGGRVFYFSIKDDKNFFKYEKDLDSFFKKHQEYKIIHCAMPSIGYIHERIAKKNGIKVRIAHSHSANHDKNLRGYLKGITSKKMKKYSTINLSCSKKAGDYLFGNENYKIIHNAVYLDKYKFKSHIRKEIRNKLGINDKIVLGHVGRISKEKNHKFLIELMKIMPDNYVLLCIGTGPNEKKIRNIVHKQNLDDKIKFLGRKDNVGEYYSVFDILLLPSLYEGLPTVAIEAQISGLPCILSNKITSEVKIINNVKFLKLDIQLWKNEILNMKIKRIKVNVSDFDKYNIKKEVRELEKIYINSMVMYDDENIN